MDREPGGLQSMGSQRVEHNWVTNTYTILNLRYGTIVSFTLSSDPSRRFGLWFSWWVEVEDPPCETQDLGWVAKRRLEMQERTNRVVLPTGLFRRVCCTLSSVTQLCPALCDPHGLQHTRPPHPSPTPRVHLNSCPLSWWYHPAISSSVVPFSSCLQSFPASGAFQMSQFFTSGGQPNIWQFLLSNLKYVWSSTDTSGEAACGHVSGIYLPVPEREGIWRLAAAAGGRRVPASEPRPLLQSAPPHWLWARWWLGSCSWQSGLSRAVFRGGRQLGSS